MQALAPTPVCAAAAARQEKVARPRCSAGRAALSARSSSFTAAFTVPASAACSGRRSVNRRAQVAVSAALKALLFDCDGVILESEDLHRRAYNAAFKHFNIKQGGEISYWSEEYYDMLSNTVGGGKPKMRWHFNKSGWPSSASIDGYAAFPVEAEQTILIDTLQDWKTDHYKELIGSGAVETRPGVLKLMDEARAAGLKVAVCSAATKSAALYTVSSLLGKQRFEALDLFLAGNDVAKLKPDPTIYLVAAERLGVTTDECLVIEDSTVGLNAAKGAKMRCVITYTRTGLGEPFDGAEWVVDNLETGNVTVQKLMSPLASPFDDRAR